MSDPATGQPTATRRGSLRILGVLLGGLAAWVAVRRKLRGLMAQAMGTPHPDGPVKGAAGYRPKWGMAIDLDKCTACQGCVVACRMENNVPTVGPEQTEKDRGIFWMDLLRVDEGKHPDLKTQFIPIPCNHCENAPCVKVCPVGATHITKEGIVAQIWARCIGCRFCTTACPYTRRYFNWQAPSWPEASRNTLNPYVATRPKGVVEKCTFCRQRIRQARETARAEGRALTDRDVQKLPACAQACPADAIRFGDLNDPDSEVSRLGRSPRAHRLQEELGTRPKVIYLRETKWRE